MSLAAAPEAAAQLSGSVKKSAPRITRPQTTPQSAGYESGFSKTRFGAGASILDTAAFKLSGQAEKPAEQDSGEWPSKAQPKAATLEAESVPRLNSGTTEEPRAGPKGSYPAPPMQQPSSEEKIQKKAKRSVIVRFLAFQDHGPDVTPYINYDGLRMAQALLDNGHEVSMLMDRHGVRLATGGDMDFGIYHTPISFVKLVKKFIADGGKVYCNKYYCDLYSVQQCDLLSGVEIRDEKELAEIIMDADKILDYDGH